MSNMCMKCETEGVANIGYWDDNNYVTCIECLRPYLPAELRNQEWRSIQFRILTEARRKLIEDVLEERLFQELEEELDNEKPSSM